MRITNSFVANLTSPEIIKFPSGKSVRIPKCEYRLTKWSGKPIDDDYNKKPVLALDGKPRFAELLILGMLQKSGWNGVWVDTYRKKFRQRFAPHECKLPSHAEALYSRIGCANGGKTAGCFDAFAWKKGKYLFVESKRRSKDRIRKTQIDWIPAALKTGLPLESLLIFEWEVEK